MTESIPAPSEELKRSSGYLIALGIDILFTGSSCLGLGIARRSAGD